MRDSILQVFLISYLLTCWIWPFAFALCLVNDGNCAMSDCVLFYAEPVR